MRARVMVAVGVVGLMLVGGACAQYGAISAPPAHAQSAPAPGEQGVKSMSLVTSLGGFKVTEHLPIVMTGQTVEIQPGGQTGRERYLVPNFVYVVQGTLTTDTAGGPVGVAGIQYHAEGQSYSSPVGAWHNHMNKGTDPVKYIVLFIGTPGGPTMEKPKAE